MNGIDTITLSGGGKSVTVTPEQFDRAVDNITGAKAFDNERPAESKFVSGRCSFQRFRVRARHRLFGEDHLQQLAAHKAGRERLASADGVEVGWSAGGHVLDATFGLAKNIINDCLAFDLRVDTNKPPAELLKAYTAVELAALTRDNPSGFPSKRQKRQAKEAATERIEQEAKDGRFIKRKCIPCLWDGPAQEVLFGSSSLPMIDRFTSLFHATFGHKLTPITADTLARDRHDVDDLKPSPFVRDVTPEDVAWSPDETSRDWLGNEFLLWLWYTLEIDSDSISLGNGEATLMLARSLVLECPRAATGTDTIRHEMPNRLPEAKRAITAGKLPRKVGLVIVRDGDTYEFNLQAETFAVGSAKLPDLDEAVIRARQEARVEQLRTLRETIDGLYRVFLDLRLDGWPKVLRNIQNWLEK